MKIKLLLIAALFGPFINATLSAEEPKLQGDIGIGYSSDTFFRGQTVSQDSLEASLGLDFNIGSLSSFADFTTSQSLEVGDDKYDISAGIEASLMDGAASLSAGLLHYELESGASQLEAFLSGTCNVLLSPTVSVYRNLDESLYTYELSVGHSLDLEILSLSLGAGFGVTELTSSNEVDYYELSAVASKAVTEDADAFLSVSYNDAENQADSDVFWGAGIKVKF